MAKKNTSLLLKPESHKKLKMLSAEWGMPMGDVIKKLLDDYGDKLGGYFESKREGIQNGTD